MSEECKVSSTADMAKQKVSFNTVNIKEAGYMYVYLSYEGAGTNWVYFDDLKITHTKTNVVQYNEYYPFGLQANSSWTRDNTTNNFLYNEASEINTTTNWYDLPFRNYDPALGRFMQVDPLAEKFASLSPYHYSNNNPVMFNDPSGLYCADCGGALSGPPAPQSMDPQTGQLTNNFTSTAQWSPATAYGYTDYNGVYHWNADSGGSGGGGYHQSAQSFIDSHLRFIITATNGFGQSGSDRTAYGRWIITKEGSWSSSEDSQTQVGSGNLIISFINSDQAKYAGDQWNYYQSSGIVDALSYAEKYAAKNGLKNLVLLSHGMGGNLHFDKDVLTASDFKSPSGLGVAFYDLVNLVKSVGSVAIIGCNAGMVVGNALSDGLNAKGPSVYINSSSTPGFISDYRNGQLIFNFSMNSNLSGAWTNATNSSSYSGLMINTSGSITPKK